MNQGSLLELVDAVNHGDTKSVKKALLTGKDPNLITKERLPLHVAAASANIPTLLLLLQFGALVDAVDGFGRAALHYAVEASVECVKILLKRNANLNIPDREGARPIHWAAYKGNTDCVKVLLEHQADVNSLTILGDSAVFWAVKKSYLDTVHLLLDYNANVGIRNSRAELPLSMALRLFYLEFNCDADVEILRLLLEVMDVSLLTERERKALDDINKSHGHPKLAYYSNYKVLSLKHMCRLIIRRSCRRGYLPRHVSQLPINRTLQEYLLLRG